MDLPPHILLGKHRLSSIDDIPEPDGNPQLFLSADRRWRKPADTVDLLAFEAAVNIAEGQAISLRDDGTVEMASSAVLSQFGRYAGVAVSSANAGDTVYSQMVGLSGFTGNGFTPGSPVFVGTNGDLTQLVPTDGYRMVVGTAMPNDQVLMSPRGPVVCLNSSDSVPRAGGTGGGTSEIRWATVQEVKDGTLPFAAISPQTLHPYINDVIAQYGLTAERIATVTDIKAGTPGKVVTAPPLKAVLDEFTGGALDYATTADIRAGTSGTKIMNPQAFKPVYDELKNMAPNIEYASAADIVAGVSGTKLITPLAYKPILNGLEAKDDELEASIPKVATQAEARAGTRNDVYLSPANAKPLFDGLAGAIPDFATQVDFTSNSTTTVVSPADINRVTQQLSATIPTAANAAEVAAGTVTDKYINPVELKRVTDGIGSSINTVETDVTNLDNRVDAIEEVIAQYEPIVWATEDDILAGTAEHKAVDPLRLQQKIDSLSIGGSTYASLDEARAGQRTDTSISPATLAVVLREQENMGLDEMGAVFPQGAG